MVNDIKVKLVDELTNAITSEAQVVYILSRIRKILESEKNKGFKELVFYCNWALHSHIEDISAVKDLIDRLLAKEDGVLAEFMKFTLFHQEFGRFLAEHEIPSGLTSTIEWQHAFNTFLSSIYTDTPMIIKQATKKKITWKGSSNEIGYAGSFVVSDETQ